MAEMLETIDVQTYSGAGPFPVNMTAIKQRAQQPVPGEPDKVWGVERIRFDCAFTAAALSAMAGATPGKRVQEFLELCKIQVKGEEKLRCNAGGRAMAELRKVQEGKVAFTAPGDIADADATVTPRYVFEYVFADPRMEFPNQHAPHAAALGDGSVKLTFKTAALVAGVTFTSVVVTTRVTYVPIPRGQIPIPLCLSEEALGNGIPSQLRANTPDAAAMINQWLALRGIVTSAGGRPQFLETVFLTLDAGGERMIDYQTIGSLIERQNQQLYDAAPEDDPAAPEVLHLIYPWQDDILLGGRPKVDREGQLVLSASLDDSGNTSTELDVITYGAAGVPVSSSSSRGYLAAIQPVHFPGATGFVEKPAAANGKATVPARLSHIIPRIAVPLTGGVK